MRGGDIHMGNKYLELLNRFTDESLYTNINTVKVDSGLTIETNSTDELNDLKTALTEFNAGSTTLIATLDDILNSDKPSLPNFIISIKKRA